MTSLKERKQEIKDKINAYYEDGILEKENAYFLLKLLDKCESVDEVLKLSALGMNLKRTGFHFDKRLEKMDNTIKYFKKNHNLSFSTGGGGITHKLIIGDNYPALLNLLISYKNKIKVIYIDPPYGKDDMGEFAKTNYDNAITRDNLLSMLYPRLQLARELLKDDGVIFCSIDDRNQAYVKCLFDEVFGEGNFVSQFVWRRKTGASDAKGIANIIEYILCYTKDNNYIANTFNENTESYDEKRYKLSDEYVSRRGKYYIDNLDRGGIHYSDSLNYGIECPDGTITYPNGRKEFVNDGWVWTWGKEKLKWGLENGFIEFRKSKTKESGWAVCYKNYLFVDNEDRIIQRSAPHKNLILDILNTHATTELNDIFDHKVFKAPKPINLIKHLLKISTNPNTESNEEDSKDFQGMSEEMEKRVQYFGDKNGALQDEARELPKTVMTEAKAKQSPFLAQKTSPLQEQDIVLDFFAGSGTTAHAVLELNREDGGKRQFILVTNNETNELNPNGIATDVTSKRLKRIMSGECYDGSKNFKWLEKNKPYGDNLEVLDIAEIASNNKKIFDEIDEKLYGKEFKDIHQKIEWVCEEFELTCKKLESKGNKK